MPDILSETYPWNGPAQAVHQGWSPRSGACHSPVWYRKCNLVRNKVRERPTQLIIAHHFSMPPWLTLLSLLKMSLCYISLWVALYAERTSDLFLQFSFWTWPRYLPYPLPPARPVKDDCAKTPKKSCTRPRGTIFHLISCIFNFQ